MKRGSFEYMNLITKQGWVSFVLTLIILLGMVCNQLSAQSASLMADGVSDFIRREQLTGKLDLKNALLLQSYYTNYRALDSLIPARKGNTSNQLQPDIKTKKPQFIWLPFSSTIQFNSHHPYGWNDGSMIPSAGVEGQVSGGFLLSTGKFTLQLKPEIVYAENTAFETFPEEFYDGYWANYYQLLNKADIPERFGNKSYHKIFPGQSSIRYNSGALSVGLSTENLWWGPGRYNALIMSNNAPGFAHITLNTTKPIETGIGSFEGQLIGGNLSASGIAPPDTNRYFNGIRLYQPKNDASRYIAGITISWQPKWVKGLFIGLAKASYLYHSDISGIADILPLQGIIRSATEMNGKKASLGSLFARYVMPEEKAELYFEFGRNDKAASIVNVITDNGYPRAYVAGFRKLFAQKHPNEFIEFAAEFTQLELPTAELIQAGTSWYANPYVRQGFTNQGQVLGAGIGPGSNSELIDISWVSRFNKVGMKFERLAHNNDFYYSAFVYTNDYTRHWIDISTTLHADWQYKRLIFSSQMALIRSLNYQYNIFPGLGYFKNGYDVLNFHASLSLAYRL